MTDTIMACGRARRLLWPDGGPRPTTPAVIDAQRHLAGCTSCRDFITDMRAIRETVGKSALRERAPAEVRDRLFAALARARATVEPRPQHGVARWLLAAAAAFLVIWGGTWVLGRSAPYAEVDALAAVAEDHARTLSHAQMASTDPAEIKSWLAAQVHFAIQVPVLPGASLRGARISILDGRRAAVVEYDVAATPLSYFIVPNGSTSSVSRAMRFDHAARAGYRLVSWREPGLLHAMIGNLTEAQLMTFAKACVEQAGRTVAWVLRPNSFRGG